MFLTTAILLASLSAAPTRNDEGGTARGPLTPHEPAWKAGLVSTWDGAIARRAEEWVRDGEEGAVLQPLARYPVAARFMLGYLRRSDRLLQRKLAPRLAGILAVAVPAETLDELFEAEVLRRAEGLKGETKAAGDARMKAVDGVADQLAGRPRFSGVYDAESVVEDVVIAAQGWCRVPERAEAGAAILRKIVERTIRGERWNSAGPAMKSLVCACHEPSEELLGRFARWAYAVPDYGSPLPPDLSARRAIEALRAGRCDDLHPQGVHAGPDPLATWTPREKAALAEFLRVAASAR
jgi:hypothetical protein